MKTLIANAYFYKLDPKQWSMHQPFPPLGTLYAAAVVRQLGHEVILHDTNLQDGPRSIIDKLQREKPDYLIIYDDGFNYLTKMCLTAMRDAAFAMQKYGREYDCLVITSSSDATDHYQKYIEHGADVIILGEGEGTLKELLTKLDAGEAIHEVEGVAFNSLTGIKIKAKRPVLKNLDELPLPAWDLVDMEAYRQVWSAKHKHIYLNVTTTRGCPYKCNWCAKSIYGNRYNSRSARSVVNELHYLKQKFVVDHFWMCDDIFGLKPGWIKEFYNELNQRGLAIKYKIQSRVDLLLNEDTIDVLVASGMDEVWLGVESGSQKILDAMDKGITINQIHQATTLLKAKGVKVGFFIQFGYLGETSSDIRKTIRLVLDLMPDELGVSVSYPLPGTRFYETVREELKMKSNWMDSADLDVMFHNTYPPPFYRKLHSLLHRLYRARKLRREWVDSIKKFRLNFIMTFVRWNYHVLHAMLKYAQLIWIKEEHRFSTKVG